MLANLTMNEARHPWSDAWLLYAVINASRDGAADLARIIASGDHYNHAVFTDDELYGGLDRLASGGWIVREKGHFIVSETALGAYAGIRKKGYSCFDEMKMLEAALNQ